MFRGLPHTPNNKKSSQPILGSLPEEIWQHVCCVLRSVLLTSPDIQQAEVFLWGTCPQGIVKAFLATFLWVHATHLQCNLFHPYLWNSRETFLSKNLLGTNFQRNIPQIQSTCWKLQSNICQKKTIEVTRKQVFSDPTGECHRESLLERKLICRAAVPPRALVPSRPQVPWPEYVVKTCKEADNHMANMYTIDH